MASVTKLEFEMWYLQKLAPEAIKKPTGQKGVSGVFSLCVQYTLLIYHSAFNWDKYSHYCIKLFSLLYIKYSI